MAATLPLLSNIRKKIISIRSHLWAFPLSRATGINKTLKSSIWSEKEAAARSFLCVIGSTIIFIASKWWNSARKTNRKIKLWKEKLIFRVDFKISILLDIIMHGLSILKMIRRLRTWISIAARRKTMMKRKTWMMVSKPTPKLRELATNWSFQI